MSAGRASSCRGEVIPKEVYQPCEVAHGTESGNTVQSEQNDQCRGNPFEPSWSASKGIDEDCENVDVELENELEDNLDNVHVQRVESTVVTVNRDGSNELRAVSGNQMSGRWYWHAQKRKLDNSPLSPSKPRMPELRCKRTGPTVLAS